MIPLPPALRPLSFSLLLLALGGCVGHTPLACPEGRDRTAHVLFATDRKQSEAKGNTAARSLDFGPGRTDPPALQLGWQDVTIGAKHRLGTIDAAVQLAPAQIKSRSGGTQSLALHRTDAEINQFTTSEVRAAIRKSPPPAGGSKRREVLVYIHGYNDTFNYAVRKTGELAADLDLITCDGQTRGVPIAYSWPAQGTFLSYLADEENAEWTQQRLVPFIKALSAVAEQEGADLHIIAHSMGCRLLVRSLAEIASAGGGLKGGKPLIDQVILLAPDMGRELFNQYSERLLPTVGHMTIYVSAKDRALALSSILHGGHHRLGLIESTIATALKITGLNSGDDPRELGQFSRTAASSKKIDMIDVTGGIADFVGHSYEDPAFIKDLRELIYHHTPAGTAGRSALKAKQVRPDLFGLAGPRLNYFELQKTGAGVWPLQ